MTYFDYAFVVVTGGDVTKKSVLIEYCYIVCVTVDGVWIGEWIY
jgi:hypothetical protein